MATTDSDSPRIETRFRRHECKYLIPEAVASGIRAYVRPYVETDPHAEASPDRSYDITSLYLDTPDLKLYHESRDGQLHRIKLRIRSYDETADSPVFLEIKRRFNSLVLKSRARIERVDMDSILAGGVTHALPGSDDEQACYQEFLGWLARWLARPAVWVRYRREAYVGIFNRDVRVTMDRTLVCSPADNADSHAPEFPWLPVETRMVILELKFDESCPDWMARLIQRFCLQRRSYSKYGKSVLRGLADASRVTLSSRAVGA